jgi:hypothetical protein
MAAELAAEQGSEWVAMNRMSELLGVGTAETAVSHRSSRPVGATVEQVEQRRER